MDDKNIQNERLDAVWCVDSGTSEDVLMDRLTNKELWRGNKKAEEQNGNN